MRAKKHLGQNFLSSGPFLRSIVSAANIYGSDTVLEIGPGKGSLTRELLLHAKKVVAVEKDPDLLPLLSEKFSAACASGALSLVVGDVLSLSPEELGLSDSPYKVVANIPYYITGELLRSFLSFEHQPSSMTLVVQKEVAERIVARDGKESILSLSVRAYGEPFFIQKIPARYFNPTPKVDSAIVHIGNISRKNFSSQEEEERYFQIVRTGFAHKRKLLLSNLKGLFDEETLRAVFLTQKIHEKARAEDLSFSIWLRMTKDLSMNLGAYPQKKKPLV